MYVFVVENLHTSWYTGEKHIKNRQAGYCGKHIRRRQNGILE